MDSVSLLTMIMNPETVEDLVDMTNKIDHGESMFKDYDMKFDSGDVREKRQCTPWLLVQW